MNVMTNVESNVNKIIACQNYHTKSTTMTTHTFIIIAQFHPQWILHAIWPNPIVRIIQLSLRNINIPDVDECNVNGIPMMGGCI
jgi:hypothetical protein